MLFFAFLSLARWVKPSQWDAADLLLTEALLLWLTVSPDYPLTHSQVLYPQLWQQEQLWQPPFWPSCQQVLLPLHALPAAHALPAGLPWAHALLLYALQGYAWARLPSGPA